MSRIRQLLEDGTICDDDVIEFSGGFLNSLINKLGDKGIELHYVSPFTGKRHNFSGPGTKLNERLDNYFELIEKKETIPKPKANSKPVNKADKAAMYHDVCYEQNKNLRDRKKCDDDMIERLKKSRRNKKEKFSDRLDSGFLEGIMRTKRFLGLGYSIDGADIDYMRDLLP